VTRKVVGVITARMGSTRLPGKVLKKVEGKSVFAHNVERMRQVKGLSSIYLATSKDKGNRPLVEESRSLKVKHYRGSEEDILQRHISILDKENANAALRITCDMPLFSIDAAKRCVSIFKNKYYDYIYISSMTMVQGTMGEVISRKAMIRIHRDYKGPAITQPIKESMGKFKTLGINVPLELCRPEYRLTVDYPEDLKLIRLIYKKLYKGKPISLYEVYKFLDDNPDLAQINKNLEVKGCVKYGDSLLAMPKYSIVKVGAKYLILNENKTVVSFEEFIKKAKDMFPQAKNIKI